MTLVGHPVAETKEHLVRSSWSSWADELELIGRLQADGRSFTGEAAKQKEHLIRKTSRHQWQCNHCRWQQNGTHVGARGRRSALMLPQMFPYLAGNR